MALPSAWIAGSAAASTDEGLFAWWSFSKTVLAIAAMRLVEQGRLALDAPRPGRPYTLRQLLLHRAGVPNYGRIAAYHEAVARGEDAWSRERLLEEARAETLDFEPGQGWSYSNIGYLFVRDAIEEAAGLPLAQALRTLVLDPLDLSGTRLATTREDFRALAWPEDYDPRWVFHGCLIGPPVEAARLLHATLGGALLSPTSLAALFERSTALGAEWPGHVFREPGYAIGLMTARAGEAGRLIGHTGAGPGSVCAVYHFPDLPLPTTAAVFSEGEDESAVEAEAMAIALRAQD